MAAPSQASALYFADPPSAGSVHGHKYGTWCKKHARGMNMTLEPGFGVSWQGQDLAAPQQGPGWVFFLEVRMS